jgi:ankyrin repeat protein
MACWAGRLDVVRELLARGANANALSDSGYTPLIKASMNGHIDVVRALLAADADKKHVTNNGDTADSLAGTGEIAPQGSRAAIVALLAAAP